jgi:hypothetical protein
MNNYPIFLFQIAIAGPSTKNQIAKKGKPPAVPEKESKSRYFQENTRLQLRFVRIGYVRLFLVRLG